MKHCNVPPIASGAVCQSSSQGELAQRGKFAKAFRSQKKGHLGFSFPTRGFPGTGRDLATSRRPDRARTLAFFA